MAPRGWALVGRSVAPYAAGWAPAGHSAGPSVDDWAQLGSVPADYSVLAGRGARLCFLVARLEHCPVAERRLDSVEDCKEYLRLWQV